MDEEVAEEVVPEIEPYDAVKKRGRDKKKHAKQGKTKKTKRLRTTSPAGGNSAKCCPICTPKYATHQVNKEYHRNECVNCLRGNID